MAENENDELEGQGPGKAAAASVAASPPEPDRDGRVTPEEAQTLSDAGEWLLQAFDNEQITLNKLILDVGAPGLPMKIEWTIKSLDGAVIRRIRGGASDQLSRTSSRRRAGVGVDEAETAYRANLAIVVAGTHEPNLAAVAQVRGIADPAILVEDAFKNKQGIIDQVAGEIMSLSGYDDEAVQDALEVSAAGNSLV